MSEAINNQTRMSQSNASMRSALEKVDKKQGAQTQATPEEAAPVKAKASNIDTLSLSNVAERVKEQPSFDRAKVESIKQVIQQGHYPLNPHRIAESFLAIEQLIRD